MTTQRKRRRERSEPERPGRPPGPGGHVSWAVEGCGCLQCRYHRHPRSTISVLRALGLERLLSGGAVLPYVAAGQATTDETWNALTGRGPFERSGPVKESPFERRHDE